MKKRVILSASVLLLIFLSFSLWILRNRSFQSDSSLSGKGESILSFGGDSVTKEFAWGAFTNLHIEGSWNVELYQGDYLIELEIPESLAALIDPILRDETLRLEKLDEESPLLLKAKVTLPHLSSLTIEESVTVKLVDIESGNLTIEASGDSSLTAKGGSTEILSVVSNSRNNIDIRELAVERGEVEIKSSGSVYTAVNSAILSNVTGSGEFIQLDKKL